MKKLIVLFCLLVASAIKAQAPQYLNYQGIARDAGGTIITTAIGVKFEILQGSASGTVVYDETNTITPSSAGIFTTAIGSGVAGIGTFSLINWANGPYYIRVNIDPAGGTSYSTVGTSQLLSVPYALYAETAGNTQTVNISGSSVTGTYPNYTITAPGALTPSTGISISGGTITNTAPNQTVTLASAGISSITGTYPSYTIDVPPPALNYNTGTNVLTLTQGTAVATTTLVGAGSSTVSMFASGIASVTPVGAGNNFTVSVQSPSFTSVGATSVTGTYPNFVINSPGASTTIPTSLQINPPHTASTLSANNFSITIQPTNISGAGVTGSYPNYTVTSPAATSLTGVGVASVSGTSPNLTVTVPGPSLTVTGNSITVTQGTVVSTKTIATSPWTYSTGVIYSNGSVLNDKVGIGVNATGSNLEVTNNAGSSNTTSPVVYVSNANTGFSANGALEVKNSSGGGAGIFVSQNNNLGDGISVTTNGVTNGGNALQATHFGLGNAGFFSINNASSNSKAIDASTNGLGSVISAVNTNSSSTAAAIYGNTNGNTALFINNSNVSGIGGSFNTIGTAVYGSNSGPYHTFQAQNTNASAGIYAGYFNGGLYTLGKTSNNSTFSLRAQNSSFSDVLAVRDDGLVGVGTGAPNAKLDVQGSATFTNNVLYVNNPNSGNTNSALYVSNAAIGGGISVSNSHINSNSANFYNTNAGSTVAAVLVQNNGTGSGVDIYNVGGGRALYASNNTTINTVLFNNSGNGYALQVQNSSAVTSRAANFIGGVDIMGKTTGSGTFPLVVTNVGSTNLFNVRDDGNVGINVSSPGYRLSVFENVNTTAAIYGSQGTAASSAGAHGVYGLSSNSNTLASGVRGESNGSGPAVSGGKTSTSGSAARFEITNAANNADGVFAATNGLGAVIHTKNTTAAGANNLGVLIEDGHIGLLQTAAPTASVNTGCTACSAGTVMPHSTDVAGTITFNMGGSYGATFDFTVNYAKPYRKIPVVNITPANLVGGNVGKIYVQNLGGAGNYTGFRVFFIGGVSGGAGAAQFNYMVIEGAN